MLKSNITKNTKKSSMPPTIIKKVQTGELHPHLLKSYIYKNLYKLKYVYNLINILFLNKKIKLFIHKKEGNNVNIQSFNKLKYKGPDFYDFLRLHAHEVEDTMIDTFHLSGKNLNTSEYIDKIFNGNNFKNLYVNEDISELHLFVDFSSSEKNNYTEEKKIKLNKYSSNIFLRLQHDYDEKKSDIYFSSDS